MHCFEMVGLSDATTTTTKTMTAYIVSLVLH